LFINIGWMLDDFSTRDFDSVWPNKKFISLIFLDEDCVHKVKFVQRVKGWATLFSFNFSMLFSIDSFVLHCRFEVFY